MRGSSSENGLLINKMGIAFSGMWYIAKLYDHVSNTLALSNWTVRCARNYISCQAGFSFFGRLLIQVGKSAFEF